MKLNDWEKQFKIEKKITCINKIIMNNSMTLMFFEFSKCLLFFKGFPTILG